jgi:hypothetical protein
MEDKNRIVSLSLSCPLARTLQAGQIPSLQSKRPLCIYRKKLPKGDSDLEAFKTIHIQAPSEQLPKQNRKTQPPEGKSSTKQHKIYSHKFLDYFMLKFMLRKVDPSVKAPKPPPNFQPD